jgi:hypothetical protein
VYWWYLGLAHLYRLAPSYLDHQKSILMKNRILLKSFARRMIYWGAETCFCLAGSLEQHLCQRRSRCKDYGPLVRHAQQMRVVHTEDCALDFFEFKKGHEATLETHCMTPPSHEQRQAQRPCPAARFTWAIYTTEPEVTCCFINKLENLSLSQCLRAHLEPWNPKST